MRCDKGRLGAQKKATMGFEPMMRVLQTLALPLGHITKNRFVESAVIALFFYQEKQQEFCYKNLNCDSESAFDRLNIRTNALFLRAKRGGDMLRVKRFEKSGTLIVK